jgi:hypothetical protein
MFVALNQARLAVLLISTLTVFGLLTISGCGEEEIIDPFVYTTMARVMDGDTLSTDFLFEIDTPEIDYVKGDVAIINDGNRMEFLVGPDLENTFANYAGGKIGVEKRFSHGANTSHMFMMRSRMGELVTPVDSVEAYILPTIFQASKQQIETPGAPLPELSWKKPSRIKEFMPENEGDSLIEVQTMVSSFVNVPRIDLSEEAAAVAGPADRDWYIVFPEASFKVVNLDQGAEYMLNLLIEKNLPLIGSFSVVSVVDGYKDRKKTYGELGHIMGEMQINWFKYANTFVNSVD